MNPELWDLAWTISRLNRVEIRIYANVNHLTANVDGRHLNQESIMEPRSLGIETDVGNDGVFSLLGCSCIAGVGLLPASALRPALEVQSQGGRGGV